MQKKFNNFAKLTHGDASCTLWVIKILRVTILLVRRRGKLYLLALNGRTLVKSIAAAKWNELWRRSGAIMTRLLAE